MKWPLVRRSKLDAALKDAARRNGIYRCGRCDHLIPIGWSHERRSGTDACTVRPTLEGRLQ